MKNEKPRGTGVPITPDKYGELLRCLELRDIFLAEAKISANRAAFTGTATLTYDEKINLVHINDDSAKVNVDYILRGKSGKRNIIMISMRMSVEFHLNSPIPSEFFDIYNASSLQLQVFPYFREFVQSTVARMGLPPLVLPLRKFIPVK